MKLSKADARTFGGLILNGGINCLVAAADVASGGPASILVELAKAITGNLASNHLAVLSNHSFEKLASRLNSPDPNNVNHDLERLFRQSAVVALEYIKTLFLSEIKEDEAWKELLSREERKNFIRGLTLFFDENISDLRNVMKGEVSPPLDKNLIREPKEILDNITDQIFRLTTVSFDPATEQRLKQFYTEKLPYCFELAFNEALKNDDHGFKAFQIWVLKEMQAQNIELSKGQQKILEAITNISNGQNLIAQEHLDDVLDKRIDKIYKLLQNDFKEDIKKAFEQIAEEIRQNFDKLYTLNLEHYDLSKEILALLKILLQKFDSRVDNSFPHELNLIPQHRDEFIGRDHDLIQLHRELQSSAKVVLVNGIGGIGKTTIAKKYVQLHRHEYDHIAWVEIKANDTVENDIAGRDAFVNAFAYDKILWSNGLRLQFEDTAPPEERFEAIIHAFKNMDGKNLLVIDNAGQEIKAFNEILPVQPRWQVLVTSRNTLTGFMPVHLDKLEKDKAVKLFSAWHKTNQKEEVEKLLQEIDYHTLMIEMLAKTLEASMGMLTVQEITKKLQTGHLDDMELQETIETSHSKKETELFRHLNITFQLADLSEMEIWAMKQFYFLLPKPYSLKTLNAWLKIKLEEEKGFKTALKKLAGKGWLKSENNTFEMHRLIQQVVNYRLKPGITEAKHLIETFIELTYFDAHTDITTRFLYIPYVQYLINKIQKPDRQNDSFASLLNNLGALYRTIQQYSEAETTYKVALDIYRKLMESNPGVFEPDVAMTLNNLGNLYGVIWQFGEGEKAYKEALIIYRKLLETNFLAFEPNLATTLNNLGVLYRNIRRYNDAEKAYKETLDIRRKLLEENPAVFEPDVATTLNKLGILYSDTRQYDNAEKVYKEALNIYRKLSEDNPAAFEPNLALTLNDIGVLYRRIRQYDEAEKAYKESLYIIKRLSQSNPAVFEPDVAKTLNNLGLLYRDIGRYNEAETAYKETLDIKKRLSESNPAAFEPDVAITLNNLGILYRDIGQYDEAKKAYKEVLNIYSKLSESNPNAFEPQVAAALNNLGILYSVIRQYDEAEKGYKGALSIYRELAENNSTAFEPDVAITLNNLGALFHDIGQYEDAEMAFKEALEIRKKLSKIYPAAFDSEVAITLNSLGILYHTSQRYDDAKKAYSEAISLRLKYLSLQHFIWEQITNLYFSVAICNNFLQEHEEALQNIKLGMVIIELYCKNQEEADPFISDAREMIEGYKLDFERFWKEEVLPEVSVKRGEFL